MVPETVGDFCTMLMLTGICKDGEILNDKQHKKKYVTCIEGCTKLDGYIQKYWVEPQADKESEKG